MVRGRYSPYYASRPLEMAAQDLPSNAALIRRTGHAKKSR
jgi:hypothetical protein